MSFKFRLLLVRVCTMTNGSLDDTPTVQKSALSKAQETIVLALDIAHHAMCYARWTLDDRNVPIAHQ